MNKGREKNGFLVNSFYYKEMNTFKKIFLRNERTSLKELFNRLSHNKFDEC